MAELLRAQLDYVLFFHGLALILLGAVCFAIGGRGPRDPPWIALGAFGVAHGAHEWLDLVALSTGDTPAFASARLVIMAASFLPLAEFARMGAARLARKVPGRWIYAPALLLVALVAVAIGPAAADAVARYVLCLTGSVGASLALVLLSRELPQAERQWALLTAAGFALYGIVAGAVVPAVPLWPALVPNHESFLRVTGMPVALVRGLLAASLAISIWGLRQQRILTDLAFTVHARQLQTQFAWMLIVLVAILGSGWALTDFWGRHSEQEIRDDVRSRLGALANRLHIETTAADNVVRSMADSPWVLPALASGGQGVQDEADQLVDTYKSAAGEAAIVYLMKADGTVIASSNRFEADSLAGKNYRFRPYFARAMTGQCAQYFAAGATTQERGYYTSCPVRDRSSRAAGVAVLKKSLDAIEFELKQLEHAFFIDPNGIVFLASDTQMLFSTLWPLPADARRTLSRSLQFGELRDALLLDREVADGTWVEFEGERHYAGRHYVGFENWSFVALKTTTAIAASRIFGITITFLFAILSLAYFVRMEQLVHDKIALAKQLALEEQARELDLRASTDPLTGAANRLKFNRELDAEIPRRARYATPISLVMFDIDHFKAVNDVHGHQEGDRVLVGSCSLVAQHIRQTDLLARWGGEEFMILTRNCGAQEAFGLAEKLRKLIESFSFGRVGTITCSFGVAQFQDGDTAESLLSRADGALYRAKASGRNRVEKA